VLAPFELRAQKFLPDDPIQTDPDRRNIPAPKSIELSKAYDFLENTFSEPGGPKDGTAANVNTAGEVPDSSWFTNRLGLRGMSDEQLVRGPNTLTGPDVSRPWQVTSLKTEGITPGLIVEDARGDTYVVKFDPLEFPQLTTSAEVISTKFFYAFGYNVPENYLAFITPELLTVRPGSEITDKQGRERELVPEDLREALESIPRRPDGTIQVMASRYLPGKPVGPFKYYGVRSDDPNDIFPHEDRRELRALRVFDSWLNHNDSDAVNTLDTYVQKDGASFLEHYLIDFGTTLGSAGFEMKGHRAGNEYYLEWTPLLRSAATLGIWDRKWRAVDYYEHPSIGRFEADYFRPEEWKPDYPNAAHERMQLSDALWAVRSLMQLSDGRIRDVVRTGQYADPAAERYLVDTLIRRRDKIVTYYLGLINPIEYFQIDPASGALRFRNLGSEARMSGAASYRYQWFQFDNRTSVSDPLDQPRTTDSTSIPMPKHSAEFLMVRIWTVSPEHPYWAKKVDVFIRNGGNKEIVGIERES
jgi:hypothetical protein